MKTSLTYGVIMAVAGAVLMLVLYFAGLQDTAEKLKTSQWIGSAGGLAIAIVCLSLAMRERRAEVATRADGEWGYGSALGVGVLTGLFGAVFGAVFTYLYFSVINPGLADVMIEFQLEKIADKGLSASQLEQVEPALRKWMSPPVMTATQGFFGFVWSVVLALLIAIVHRKPANPPDAAFPSAA